MKPYVLISYSCCHLHWGMKCLLHILLQESWSGKAFGMLLFFLGPDMNLDGGFNFFLCSPLFGEEFQSNLTHIFQMGWNHQLVNPRKVRIWNIKFFVDLKPGNLLSMLTYIPHICTIYQLQRLDFLFASRMRWISETFVQQNQMMFSNTWMTTSIISDVPETFFVSNEHEGLTVNSRSSFLEFQMALYIVNLLTRP